MQMQWKRAATTSRDGACSNNGSTSGDYGYGSKSIATKVQAEKWNQYENIHRDKPIFASIVLLSHELASVLQEPRETLETLEIVRKVGKEDQSSTTMAVAEQGVKEMVKKVQNAEQEVILEETVKKIEADLRHNKFGVDSTLKDLAKRKNSLQKAQRNIVVQTRAIEVCKREIDHHCCQCGGIHVFSDHEPTQRESCQRLKNKVRSLGYLKQACKEASTRVKTCQMTVDNGIIKTNDAQAGMTASLSQGLGLLESIQRNGE